MKSILLLPLFICCWVGAIYAQDTSPITSIANVPFSNVANSPIYPGCEHKDNSTVKKCTQESIDRFLFKNFNTSLLTIKDRRVGLHFTISENGKITNISAAIPSKHLEKEIQRVAALLPSLAPGEHRGKQVPVLYGTLLDFSEFLHKKRKKS